jgi:putative copper export protein/methionine-rich copper-binding protein CopC
MNQLRQARYAPGILVSALVLLASASAPPAVNARIGGGALMAPHAELESSVPKDKDTLSAVPRELRLKFTEAPELPVTKVKLHGPDGKEISLGKLTVVDSAKVTIVAPITGVVGPGMHTVDWATAGEDGHVVDGFIAFTVLPDAAGSRDGRSRQGLDASTVSRDTGSMTPADTFDAESAGYVFVRFVLYTALLIVIGAVVFRAVVLPLALRRPDVDAAFVADAARRAGDIGSRAAMLLVTACVARVIAQSLSLHGSDAMFDFSRIGVLVRETKWGRAWIVQIVAAMLALYGFRSARRNDESGRRSKGLPRVTSRMGWIVAAVAALILVFTPAFAGHAAASPRMRSLALLFDGLHVVGAAGWLGSLFLILTAGIPAAMALNGTRRGGAVRNLINAFSPTALVFAGLVIGTGVFAAWLHAGSFAALWESRYGNLLLTKLAVVFVLALIGGYNWRRVKPTLGTVEATARIQRSAIIEVTVAVVILLVTAILVATPLAVGTM